MIYDNTGIKCGNTDNWYKTNHRRYTKRLTGYQKTHKAAKDSADGSNNCKQYIAHISIKNIEQNNNKEDRNGNWYIKSLKSLLHFIEHTTPLHIIPIRKFYFFNLFLRFLNCSPQIFWINIELDGNISLVVLPVNKRSSGIITDFSYPWKRYNSTSRKDYRYTRYSCRFLPIFIGKAHLKRKIFLSFDNLADNLAAQCSRYHVKHILYI